MSHSSSWSNALAAARPVFALLACIVVVGCVGFEQPPYVEEDAKSKAPATCQTPEQQKTEACKAAGGH